MHEKTSRLILHEEQTPARLVIGDDGFKIDRNTLIRDGRSHVEDVSNRHQRIRELRRMGLPIHAPTKHALFLIGDGVRNKNSGASHRQPIRSHDRKPYAARLGT